MLPLRFARNWQLASLILLLVILLAALLPALVILLLEALLRNTMFRRVP